MRKSASLRVGRSKRHVEHPELVEGRSIIASKSGAVYLLALITLLVGMILGLAMIRSSSSSFYAEDSRSKTRAAINIADAGADYAYWQVHWKNRSLPYSADVSLSSGSFHVDATDDGSNLRSTMKIICTATSGKQSYTLKRETVGLLPYHYGWCESVGTDDGDILLIPSSPRGIRSNGSIKLTNATTNIPSGGWSNTTFECAGVVSPQYINTPKIAWPDIDNNYYRSIATAVFGWPASWVSVGLSQANFPAGGGVIFVYGDISSMSNIVYSGVWIVVATDDIILDCPITAANANSYLVLMAGHNMTISTSDSAVADNLDAVVYCPYGFLNLRGNQYGIGIRDNNFNITGSLASSDFTTSGDGGNLTTTINWDTRLTPTVMRDQLHLPGL